MKKKIIIFAIVDSIGQVWGLAPSKIQARKQIAWHLPKNNAYQIDVRLVYTE